MVLSGQRGELPHTDYRDHGGQGLPSALRERWGGRASGVFLSLFVIQTGCSKQWRRNDKMESGKKTLPGVRSSQTRGTQNSGGSGDRSTFTSRKYNCDSIFQFFCRTHPETVFLYNSLCLEVSKGVCFAQAQKGLSNFHLFSSQPEVITERGVSSRMLQRPKGSYCRC